MTQSSVGVMEGTMAGTNTDPSKADQADTDIVDAAAEVGADADHKDICLIEADQDHPDMMDMKTNTS